MGLPVQSYSRLLEITGGYWRLLEITGDNQRLLEITTDYYRLLEISSKWNLGHVGYKIGTVWFSKTKKMCVSQLNGWQRKSLAWHHLLTSYLHGCTQVLHPYLHGDETRRECDQSDHSYWNI